jgi:citronellol/citronellal dehydrogenase
MDFKNKTVVITGGSRGIGHAIGLKMASMGANIAILAKTTEPNPRLPGTIYTAADDMIQAGGQALALQTDIRFEDQVIRAMDQVVSEFGGIDILVNNASAINLSPTLSTDMKRYDLMNGINTRGTFLCSKICIPHLLKASNPHVLNLSPPLSLNPIWFKDHIAYTLAKMGMSLCTLGMAEEFKNQIAFNALWPRITIATSAVNNLLGGESLMKRSRLPNIVADAAALIFEKDYKTYTGHFLTDEEVLMAVGIHDFSRYRVSPEYAEEDLQLDFFL